MLVFLFHEQKFWNLLGWTKKILSTTMREPINAPGRIASRDAKLLNREQHWAETNNYYLVKCKCNICVGSPASKRSPAMARAHLSDFGRHPYFRGQTQGIPPDSSDEEWDSHIKEEYGRFGRARLLREAAPVTDANMNITGLVQNAFHWYEEMSRDAEEFRVPIENPPDSDPPPPPHVPEQYDEESDEDGVPPANQEEDYTSAAQRMLEESSHTLLYAGSCMSSLSATMILLQACRTHKCSSTFITELLTILKNAILPEINTLPSTEYAATKLLRRLGLQHQDIDICPNTCMKHLSIWSSARKLVVELRDISVLVLRHLLTALTNLLQQSLATLG
ncbi:hypothetical protein M758_UG337700 [Ceratodon purpureus]|nr:hypothetical protein M758_UG337700 [Ceratodon purpureus]